MDLMLIDLLESSKAIGLCPMGIFRTVFKYNPRTESIQPDKAQISWYSYKDQLNLAILAIETSGY